MTIDKKSIEKIVQHLEVLLGDGEGALNPENFAAKRVIIEKAVFPAVETLGFDISQIKTDYNLELLQCSRGPDHPSSGRLDYIKGHLKTLSERLKQYKNE